MVNTLSNNVGQCSLASATVRELHKHHPSEYW